MSNKYERSLCNYDLTDLGEMLAHVASFQGEMVAEIISGKNRIYDPVAVPAIVFTEPEVVSVGMSPDEAKMLDIQLLLKIPQALTEGL